MEFYDFKYSEREGEYEREKEEEEEEVVGSNGLPRPRGALPLPSRGPWQPGSKTRELNGQPNLQGATFRNFEMSSAGSARLQYSVHYVAEGRPERKREREREEEEEEDDEREREIERAFEIVSLLLSLFDCPRKGKRNFAILIRQQLVVGRIPKFDLK